jgi:hypothetical protein
LIRHSFRREQQLLNWLVVERRHDGFAHPLLTLHGCLLGTLVNLFEGGALWRRCAAAKFGAALEEATSTDALVDVLVAAGEGEDFVDAAHGNSSGAAGRWLDETEVAAEQANLADLALFLFGDETNSERLGGYGEAAAVADAEAVFFASVEDLPFGAVHGGVAAAAGSYDAGIVDVIGIGHGELLEKLVKIA